MDDNLRDQNNCGDRELKSFQNLLKNVAMETTHTFSVDFLIRKSKGDKSKAFIYARITLDGDSKELSIQEEIATKDWDTKTETVKGRSIEAQSINGHIEDVRYKIKQKYRELKTQNALLTATSVKQAYLGNYTLLRGHKLMELLAFFQKIWEPKMDSFKNYRTTIKYVKQFLRLDLKVADLFLSEIDMEFITNLEYYIREHPVKDWDPCLGNGPGKHIQRFKRIMNWAKSIKWIKENPVADFPAKLKKNKRKKLSIEALVTLENQGLSDKKLQFVKDLFLYSCYSGLAYAEVMKLDDHHFEWDTNGVTWCLIYRDKTEELCPVPLLKSASEILTKYRAIRKPGETKIFPRISNKDVNENLKVIQQICHIFFR